MSVASKLHDSGIAVANAASAATSPAGRLRFIAFQMPNSRRSFISFILGSREGLTYLHVEHPVRDFGRRRGATLGSGISEE